MPPTPADVGWGLSSQRTAAFPQPPFNGQVTSPYHPGVYDIRWDDPRNLASNGGWGVVGVNVYRSDVGEYGPYHRITNFPVGGTFYRDNTQNVLISREPVSWIASWQRKGDAPNDARWVFRTQSTIVKNVAGELIYGNAPSDVILEINGEIVPVDAVVGKTGEVTLVDIADWDDVTDRFAGPVLPDETSQVYISYFTNRNHVKYGLDQKIWYRVTTVATDPDSPFGMTETPLDYCQPLIVMEVEAMDWIWREAVRRNNWIVEQGGERVKIFIRRTSGIPCTCGRLSEDLDATRQPRNRCILCMGTGFLGGYEGPYEAVIAPDDAPREVEQTPRGRTLQHTYDVWMGPTPLLTQRDFIVKQTNERYSVSAVHRPTNRGNILQQHFRVQYLDPDDIRYRVPVDGTEYLLWSESRTTIDAREETIVFPLARYGVMTPLVGPCIHTPQIFPSTADYKATPTSTDKSNIPDSREHRGRSKTWENQNY